MASNPSTGRPVPPILQVGDVLLSSDIITRRFCCDLSACHGACCVEGDDGAPVTLDEIARIESLLDKVLLSLHPASQSVIASQGVAYADPEGELVTSIVNGRDCVFTCDANVPHPCTMCALERCTGFKPISCALYPIREKTIGGIVCLNYHRWSICRPAELKGERLNLPLYKFLRLPLTRRFGTSWYEELSSVAQTLNT